MAVQLGAARHDALALARSLGPAVKYGVEYSEKYVFDSSSLQHRGSTFGFFDGAEQAWFPLMRPASHVHGGAVDGSLSESADTAVLAPPRKPSSTTSFEGIRPARGLDIETPCGRFIAQGAVLVGSSTRILASVCDSEVGSERRAEKSSCSRAERGGGAGR